MILGRVSAIEYKTCKHILTRIIKLANLTYFNDFIYKHKKDSRVKKNLINYQIGRIKPI